jgi:transposase
MWGVVGIGFRKLVVLGTDRVDSADYVDTLRRYLLPAYKKAVLKDDTLHFMQDGAPSHTAKTTTAALAKWQVKMFGPWPPTSPDLNPIENVWSLVGRQIGATAPRKREELIEAITNAWNSIPQSTIDSLVGSFTGRCVKCVERQGAKVQK